MKYALIGCGRISYNHIAAAMANDLEITAVCDVVPSHMENKVESLNASVAAALMMYETRREK